MPRRKKLITELATEAVIKKLFPKQVVALAQETANREPKTKKPSDS